MKLGNPPEKTDVNNPPAFPYEHINFDESRQHVEGMTLRDYFRARAMQSLIIAKGFPKFVDQKEAHQYVHLLVGTSNEIADAMLKARTKD